MDQAEEDLDMEAVKVFLRDQELKLKSDKLTLSSEVSAEVKLHSKF